MASPTSSTISLMSAGPVSSQLPPQQGAILIANNPLPSPEAMAQEVEKSKGCNWQKASIRALNLCSSVTLGTFTGLAFAGVMTTPIGWAVAGGALSLGLMGAKAMGSDELKTNLGISAAGFALAVGPAYLSTKSVVAAIVCIAAEIMLLLLIKGTCNRTRAQHHQAPQTSSVPSTPTPSVVITPESVGHENNGTTVAITPSSVPSTQNQASLSQTPTPTLADELQAAATRRNADRGASSNTVSPTPTVVRTPTPNQGVATTPSASDGPAQVVIPQTVLNEAIRNLHRK